MSRHSVCEGCPKRHTYCRPQCEDWKKEEENRDKLREKKRKREMLDGALVEMAMSRGRKR